MDFTTEKIKNLLDNSIRYKSQLGLPRKWAENENFKLGDQWPPVTEKTKAFPRPVFNICDYIIQHKTSSVQNENVKMVFNSDENEDKAELFSNFSTFEWERLKMADKNSYTLEGCATKGVAISYFYIEPSPDGLVKLQYENIDPTNGHVGNPKQVDIQKQPWIIIVQRIPLEDVKEIALGSGIKIDNIQEDKEILGSEYANKNVDIDGIEKVNLITIFYKKKDGYVYYKKICDMYEIQPETPLKLKKYPFASLRWADKTEDFYSKGEIDFVKPNQKAINTLVALQLMSAQLTGFPKMWTKKGALNTNSVKNTLSEILVDNSQQQGQQFGYLQPQPMNNQILTLTQNLLDYTKDLQGAHDMATGAGKADNATAIMLLQKSAGVPLDKIRKRFYQYIEDVGLIWKEFFCAYYLFDRPFNYVDADGDSQKGSFNAEGIDPESLKLSIDIGVASQWSEEFAQTSLDRFLDMGLIDFKTYLKLAPLNVVPFKNSLLKIIEQQEHQQAEEAQEYLISQMSDSEKAIFFSSPPEKQNQILMELTKKEQAAAMDEQQMMQQQPQNNKNSKNMKNNPQIG